MTKIQRVLIMAGGTGGHVFPGLAVAKSFREQGVTVQWLGTRKGLEARLVPEADFKLHFIGISGLRGKGWKDLVVAPWRLLLATLEARRIIKAFDPNVVIGMGGFASGPGGIATFLLGIKLVIHEQNAKPGLTNKWLSLIATKVLEGFPNTFKQTKTTITTGNPVRKEISDLPSPENRLKNRLKSRLLVFGGSLGAAALNELMPKALARVPEAIRPDIIHQSGNIHFADTAKAYESLGLSVKVVPFIDDMGEAYAWADMVLCRAGALTIAELCAVGLGAILVPYPYAVDDHQTANAKYMAEKKAAILIQQADLTVDALVKLLEELCMSADKRMAMAKAAFQLRKVDATEKVLNICEEICH
jgi:UDP-N-acetylglucosamine--N-acetylmuramyl-(pentapeptide) pyrophosphoryl-undecaprenol N-acetylglucosamine transferase